MDRICVYAGSSPGADPRYSEAARALGAEIAQRGLGVVYGGATVGLMGVLADAARAGGAEVIGVLPQSLADHGIAHEGIDLRVVPTMHERKALMADLSGGFVALPGGIGTLEETFEVLTWAQLGHHAKPVGLLDVAGFFTSLGAFLDHCVAERFVRGEHRAMLLREEDPAALLDAFAAYEPPRVEKWIDRDSRT